MLRLKGTCLLLYATCQLFQHILHIGHFMVTEELVEPGLHWGWLQKCCLGLCTKSLIDWIYFISQKRACCMSLPLAHRTVFALRGENSNP